MVFRVEGMTGLAKQVLQIMIPCRSILFRKWSKFRWCSVKIEPEQNMAKTLGKTIFKPSPSPFCWGSMLVWDGRSIVNLDVPTWPFFLGGSKPLTSTFCLSDNIWIFQCGPINTKHSLKIPKTYRNAMKYQHSNLGLFFLGWPPIGPWMSS